MSQLRRDTSPTNKWISWLASDSVMYKPHQLLCEPAFPRFIYLDVGAASYDASVGEWFRKIYPGHERFSITAFEADILGGKTVTFKKHPEVELLKVAAWIENTTLDFISEGYGAHLVLDNLTAQREAGVKVDLSRLGEKKQVKRLIRVPAVDIADFLKRRVVKEDYVVMKMDVEGAESKLIPHLLASGVAELIDEFFAELHAPPAPSSVMFGKEEVQNGTWLRKPLASGYTEETVLELVRSLRSAGVYAHQWY